MSDSTKPEINKTCLVLDTTNMWITVGIFGKGRDMGKTIEAPRESFTKLYPVIREMLEGADIKRPDWIACVRGPGSFTGSRIGVGTARNLSQLWEIPVLGLDSIGFYVYSIKDLAKQEDPVAILLDAKQKRVYAGWMTNRSDPAAYREIVPLDDNPLHFISMLPENCEIFADDPETILGYMDESSAAGRHIERLPSPDARYLYDFALSQGGIEEAITWDRLEPFYLRTDPAHQKYPDGYNRNL